MPLRVGAPRPGARSPQGQVRARRQDLATTGVRARGRVDQDDSRSGPSPPARQRHAELCHGDVVERRDLFSARQQRPIRQTSINDLGAQVGGHPLLYGLCAVKSGQLGAPRLGGRPRLLRSAAAAADAEARWRLAGQLRQPTRRRPEVGGPAAAVSEPSGHGPHVHASGDQLGRRVVPELVELVLIPSRRAAGRSAGSPSPGRGGSTRPERGEHEGVVRQLRRARAARLRQRRRCSVSSATVSGSRAMRRCWWALVSFSHVGRPRWPMLRSIASMPPSRSRWRQRRPHSSPRRAPLTIVSQIRPPSPGPSRPLRIRAASAGLGGGGSARLRRRFRVLDRVRR